jgi:hypothetical protein
MKGIYLCHCERAFFASEAVSQQQKGLLRRPRTAARKDKEGLPSYLMKVLSARKIEG